MNKKKLPKAIRHATNDMNEAAPAFGVWEQQVAPARSTVLRELADDGAAAPDSGYVGDVIEVVPARAAFGAVQRRSRADAIVMRHSTYSAVGGLIPLPIANVASITAVIVRMVKVLSDLYGVPFERDRARAIVVGLMGGAMPTGLAAVATSTLVYIVPGSNLIGLAVSSIAAVACTRSIGRIFVEHFESGATLRDLSVIGRS